MEDLSDLKFTHSDEWVREEDGRLVLGITDYAQSQLEDIMHVELPEPDDHPYDTEDSLGVVESLSASMEFHAPVPGLVVEINTALLSHPELITADPYGKGWIVVIKPNSPGGLEELMDVLEYESSLPEEDDD